MGDLTEHFSRHEFSCKCGCGFDTVDYELLMNLEELADRFMEKEPDAHRVAIHINSGNRCREHDRKIKIKQAQKAGRPFIEKKSKSQHLVGRAADFRMEYVFENGRRKIPDDDIADLLELIYVARHGIGRYSGRTHYDTRTNGPARWDNR